MAIPFKSEESKATYEALIAKMAKNPRTDLEARDCLTAANEAHQMIRREYDPKSVPIDPATGLRPAPGWLVKELDQITMRKQRLMSFIKADLRRRRPR